jgi:predicted metal-dependent hydrolase
VRLTSKEEETEADFKIRVAHILREQRDEMISKLRAKYAEKMGAINDKIRRAQGKIEQQNQKLWFQRIRAVLAFLTSLLKALFGRKLTKGTISDAGTSLRRATQIANGGQSSAQAEESVQSYQQKLEELEEQLNNEIALQNNIEEPSIESIEIRPRKSDIAVEKIMLVWWPL